MQCRVCVLFMQDGMSPLFAATVNGHTDIVDLLVRAGADVHLSTTEVLPLYKVVSVSHSMLHLLFMCHDMRLAVILSLVYRLANSTYV